MSLAQPPGKTLYALKYGENPICDQSLYKSPVWALKYSSITYGEREKSLGCSLRSDASGEDFCM